MSNNKFKILIVEDEPTICSFIYTLLDTNGYKKARRGSHNDRYLSADRSDGKHLY